MEILVPLVVFLVWWFCYLILFQSQFAGELSAIELLGVSISFTIVIQTFVCFVLSIIFTKTYTMYFILLLPLIFAGLGIRSGFSLKSLIFSRYEFVFAALFSLYLLFVGLYIHANFHQEGRGLSIGNLFATEILWHASLVSQLDQATLPSTLQFYPTSFASYHFFPDLFVYILSRVVVFNQPLYIFVYVFLPIVLTAFALNTYALASRLWNSKVGLVAVFIMLFCYDSTSLILWGKGLIREHTLFFGSYLPDTQSFWTPILTQFQIFHNPSIVLSSALILNAFLLTYLYFESKKASWLILSALAWIFLAKVKITTFLIGITGLAITAVLRALFRREWHGLKLLFVIIFASLPVLWLCVAGTGNINGAILSNFFFINNFAVRTGFISRTASDYIREFGHPGDAWTALRFFLAFCFYFVGILGFRLIALCYRGYFERCVNLIRNINFHGMLIFTILAGFLVFTIFGAKIAMYDTLWFFMSALFILNLYTADRIVYLFSLKEYFPFKLIVGVLVFFSVLSFIIPALRGNRYQGILLSSSQLGAFESIRHTPDQGRIMTRHYDLIKDGDERNFLLTAFTSKPVVAEGIDYTVEWRLQDSVFINKTRQLRSEIDEVFQTPDAEKAKKWLDQFNISFVYLQSDTLHFDVHGILEKIYDQDSIQVYSRVSH